MKPILHKAVALIGCYFFLYTSCPAQYKFSPITVDGVVISASHTPEQEPIYRGEEYLRFPHRISNGIASYKADTITSGEIVYYNRLYKNVPLVYDQITDELVTLDFSGGVMIRMFTPEIKSFRIYGADFIYFTDTSNADKQGFWEVLVDADTRLLKREIKLIQERIINSRIGYVILPKLFYRIFHKGKYYDVEDRGQMIDIFNHKKLQVQSFLKANRRRFRKGGFEVMLKATTNHYNEIVSGR